MGILMKSLILGSMIIAIQGKLPIYTTVIILIHTALSCKFMSDLLEGGK